MNTLPSLFAQKSWSNHELFNALAVAAPSAQADAVHAAVRMHNHIHVVDCIFRAHLAGEPHGYTATNTDATPTIDELQMAVADTDAWFERHVATLSPAQLGERIAFRFTDGDQGLMTREEILMHVILHGAYHRGNVGQMLKSMATAPPRDLYTRFLHTREPSRRQA